MSRTVLVTGGAGYIGSHVAWALLDAGYNVAILDNLVTGLRSLVPPGDAPALARALAQLVGDPALRARLGRAGEARVRGDFDSVTCIDDLARHFQLPDG